MSVQRLRALLTVAGVLVLALLGVAGFLLYRALVQYQKAEGNLKAARGELEAGVPYGRADAIPALLHAIVREAYDGKPGHAKLDVCLHHHTQSVRAPQIR